MKTNTLAEMLDFGLHAPRKHLQQFMLNCLNKSANLGKRIEELRDEQREADAAALLAELLLMHGEELLCGDIFASDHRQNGADGARPYSLAVDHVPDGRRGYPAAKRQFKIG